MIRTTNIAIKVLFLFLTILVFLWLFIFYAEKGQTRSDASKISESIGGQVYFLDVALTDAEKEKGLSGRSSLAPDTGMLFVFDKPGTYGFWMPDMSFPIDIIWLDQSCMVVGKTSMTPQSYPKIFYPDYPAEYAIELPLNAAKNIFEGYTLSCGSIKSVL